MNPCTGELKFENLLTLTHIIFFQLLNIGCQRLHVGTSQTDVDNQLMRMAHDCKWSVFLSGDFSVCSLGRGGSKFWDNLRKEVSETD